MVENNKKIKISIIVPIFNSEDYLDRCILSIINQSYRNLEIILVNDGSYDSSKNIINKYMTKDNRIIYIEKENGDYKIKMKGAHK